MNQKLLQKLKLTIKSQSVNSLGTVYPEDLMSWLNVSAEELNSFVYDLYEERVLAFKYRFVCECGEQCTAYGHKLEFEPQFFCPVCGREYKADDILHRAEVLYELDKNEILELGYSQIDLKKASMEQAKIVPINSQKQNIKQEKKVMEIFLGSSSEAKDYMEEIALYLQELDQDTLMWTETGKGIFVPGTNTIDALIDITKKVQAAVFIFNVDDTTWNENSALEEAKTVRDNVLFEYGLFTGALGKNRVCFVCKGRPKVATDLKGITYIDGDQKPLLVKNKLKDWLNAM